MTERVRVALVCEGNAERDAFSGTARCLVTQLRALGDEVRPIDVRLPRPLRALNAALTFSPARDRWRARFRYGSSAFSARSLLGRAGLAMDGARPDVVLQIGATLSPPGFGRIPFALFCDWNMALSARFGRERGWDIAPLPQAELHRIDDRERVVYHAAARIFTMSAALKRSFIDDYGIPSERVVVAYPGANLDRGDVPPPGATEAVRNGGRILFVGYEFQRKGGDVLLQAFRLVRQAVPEARLTIVGPSDIGVPGANVEVLGRLRKDVPAERARLLRAFAEADVFCLPSQLEPLGIVVIEAMLFELPCVTSDVFALPEMVVDGETGFTVPRDDAPALAARLVDLLRDRSLRRRLGREGRRRAEALFTYPSCARIVHQHLSEIRSVSTRAASGGS